MQPTRFQTAFAAKRIWTVGFYGLSVAVGVAIASRAVPDWYQVGVLVLAGSLLGACLLYLPWLLLWRTRVRLNGGPFQIGDKVVIIAGVHAGRIVEIYEVWPTRSQVKVFLGEAEKKKVVDVFSYVEVCRV